MDFYIREATFEDLAGIVEAYNTSIPSRNSTCDITPITVDSRTEWFLSASKTRPIWVGVQKADESNRVLGYLSFSNFMNDRPGYSITADMGLYIHSDFHNCGLGGAFLRRAIDSAVSMGIETFATTIFSSNEASINLFKKFGFEQWGYMPRVAQLDGIEKDLVMVGLRVKS